MSSLCCSEDQLRQQADWMRERQNFRLWCLALVLLFACGLASCSASQAAQPTPFPTATATKPAPTAIPPTPTETPPPVVSPYIGSHACQECHEEIYAAFQNSGHAWAMIPVSNGEPALPPYTRKLELPEGYEYADVSYIIGGYRWQAMLANQEGMLITAPPHQIAADGYLNQYNLPNITLGIPAGWKSYRSGEQVEIRLCANCHATGGAGEDANAETLPGVQCEACHGPGREHAEATAPEEVKMPIHRERAACERCHRSPDPVAIDPETGLIHHDEIYTDLEDTGHADLECVECHDPHAGILALRFSGAETTLQTCESCHPEQAYAQKVVIHFPMNVECLDCHMPRLIKKASAVVERFTGDVRTHQSVIAANRMEQVDSEGNVYPDVGLNYACNHCHAVGGEAAPISDELLLQVASDYHQEIENNPFIEDRPTQQP